MSDRETPISVASTDLDEDTDDIKLVDVISFVQANRIFLLTVSAIGLLTGLILAFALPVWYTATARILPPQQSHSTAFALLGQLGPLATAAAGQVGLKNPSDTYVAILKSRTVADNIIKRFDLLRVYDEKLTQDARTELARNSAVSAGRDGLIAIEVDDRDAVRSAAIANAFVEELEALTAQLAVTEAAQRRRFFELQLEKAKSDLSSAELSLRAFAQEAGLVSPDSQIGLSVSTAATLRAQVAAREIQLASMGTFATDLNPEVTRLRSEIAGLKSELRRLEKDKSSPEGNVLVPFSKAPEIGLEYVRRVRDVKYYETLFELLAKQYEIAKIDESRQAPLIQVLDTALPPEKRSKPKRALLVLVATLLGISLAFALAYMKRRLQETLRDPRLGMRARPPSAA